MRLIDADALTEKWYEVNNIGPEDRGARFIGYTEIPRFINNAPTVQPTGDLISKEEDYAYCNDCEAVEMCMWHPYDGCIFKIQSRPQGEWIFNPTDAIDLMFAKPKCSKCGFESSDGGNFCPNCGARMKGGEDE